MNNSIAAPQALHRRCLGTFFLFGLEATIFLNGTAVSHRLHRVYLVARDEPGEQFIANHITGIMSKFGAGTFEVGEILADVCAVHLKLLWQSLVKMFDNAIGFKVYWKATDDMPPWQCRKTPTG